MATAVARAPRPRAQPKARPRPRRKADSGRRVAGGAVFIVLMGLLLAGVVALNVAVLRLNLRYDELDQERGQLRAQSAELSSKLAVRAASARTTSLSRSQLGLVRADPAMTTYLQLDER